MILRVSLRSLIRHRTRTILALAGITVSAALLIDMTMLASGLTRSFGELTRAQGYAVRVTPAGTLPFDSEAGIEDASAVRRRIAALPGVTGVAPVLGGQLYLLDESETLESLFTVGVDPAAQMLYLITAGQEPRAGEVVVSEPLAEARGLTPGDTVRLAADLDASLGRARAPEPFRVAAVGEFLYDAAGQRSLAMPLDDLQRLTRRPEEVSLFAVAATASDDAVAASIESTIQGVSAYSTAELMAAMDRRLLYFRQLATILGSVSLAVASLLVATIVAIGVRERFGEIAVMRAIGIARRRLLAAIMAEGLALALIGCLLGLPLGFAMAGRLDRILLAFPGIPASLSFFVFDPPRVLLALLLVIGAGALSGLVPGLGAVRAPLGRALREEAE